MRKTEKTEKIKNALKSKSFYKRKKNKNHIGWEFIVRTEKAGNRKKTGIWTFYSHGDNSISQYFLSKMAKQLHLESDEFEDLIDCPLSAKDFFDLMVERGHIDPDELKN